MSKAGRIKRSPQSINSEGTVQLRINNLPEKSSIESKDCVTGNRHGCLLIMQVNIQEAIGLLNMAGAWRGYSFFGIGGGVYSFHLPSVTNLDGSFGEVRGALT